MFCTATVLRRCRAFATSVTRAIMGWRRECGAQKYQRWKKRRAAPT